MPRQKNVVTVDVGSPASVKNAVRYYSEMARLVRASEKTVAEQTAIGIRNTHVPQLLAILRIYPPPHKGKIRWTSKKQQRAWWASDGFGRGIPSKRTGALAAGWKSIVSVTVVGQRVRLIVKTWNEVSYTRFVKGDFGIGISRVSFQRYLKPHQGFHRDTGWQAAAPDIAFFYQRMKDYAQENYRRYYERLFSGEL